MGLCGGERVSIYVFMRGVLLSYDKAKTSKIFLLWLRIWAPHSSCFSRDKSRAKSAWIYMVLLICIVCILSISLFWKQVVVAVTSIFTSNPIFVVVVARCRFLAFVYVWATMLVDGLRGRPAPHYSHIYQSGKIRPAGAMPYSSPYPCSFCDSHSYSRIHTLTPSQYSLTQLNSVFGADNMFFCASLCSCMVLRPVWCAVSWTNPRSALITPVVVNCVFVCGPITAPCLWGSLRGDLEYSQKG